jgi:ElaB/YqjD/DUF883 family membrane-anchored ribosome-binding protein
MAAIKSTVDEELFASDRLREQASAVTKDIQELGAIASDAAHEKLAQMRAEGSALCDQGCDNMRYAARSLEQYIARQPLTSVLIAGGVGVLLGCFWRRR